VGITHQKPSTIINNYYIHNNFQVNAPVFPQMPLNGGSGPTPAKSVDLQKIFGGEPKEGDKK